MLLVVRSLIADLLVCGVDDAAVQELKKCAGAHGGRAEAEPRAILADLLTAMPDVGRDSDFQRVEEPLEACDVFD